MLTIIGVSRLPDDVKVNLNGKPGEAPGGGGGGAGALVFQGRPADEEDLRGGLSVSSLLTANAATARGLLGILDGAWSYCPVANIPSQVTITVAFVVEFGRAAEETLFRLDLVACNPKGSQVAAIAVDVAVPKHDLLVRRSSVVRRIGFEVSEYGVWHLEIKSGERSLAKYAIEFRSGDPISV